MAVSLRQQPLYAADSSTAITPLSLASAQRLSGAGVAHLPMSGKMEEAGIDSAISQAIARLTLAAESPAGNASERLPRPPSPQIQRPFWRWVCAVGMTLSLAGNVVSVLALRRAQLPGPASCPVSGTVVAVVATQGGPGKSEAESPAGSPCVRNSTQTITGAERDRLLHSAITEYAAGQRAETLRLLRRYVSEACDAATLQAVTILEHELAQPSKELVKSP